MQEEKQRGKPMPQIEETEEDGEQSKAKQSTNARTHARPSSILALF